jgi:DNA-binding NtrC family response regulator
MSEDHAVLTSPHWAGRAQAAQESSLAFPIVGTSRQIAAVRSRIASIAGTNATVLITGESGTGKELVARNIHLLSNRARQGQFIGFNCSSVTETLAETTLFGNTRGAFTDAKMDKPGIFEQAHNGTLLLDEVGDMSLTIQPKILRVMESKRVQRVGGSTDVSIDVRIIAATNKQLDNMVYDGTFRNDLYMRLRVVTIALPPLRQHKDDIPELAAYFLRLSANEHRKNVHGFGEGVVGLLQAHDWPGNVRELRNLIESAVIESTGPIIERDQLNFGTSSSERWQSFLAVRLPPNGIPLIEIERQALMAALVQARGVQKDAAELLFISPRVINYKVKQHGIDVRSWSKWRRTASED